MKVRHVFLHLREHGRSLIVLQVHSFDFFRYGLTEVYSTAPSLAQLKGRQYQSLGQAAQEIHVHIYGKDRGYVNYSLEYEAYCIGLSEEACATHSLARLRAGSCRTASSSRCPSRQNCSPRFA
jgi:hypothetical protein